MGRAMEGQLTAEEFVEIDECYTRIAAFWECSVEEVKNYGVTLLHSAVGFGKIETVKSLVLAGEDIQAKDKGGRTPLHVAVVIGRTEIAELLVSAGANLPTKTKGGRTPLHWATDCNSERNIDIVKLLVFSGANVNMKDKKGRTPLHVAIRHYGKCYNLEVVKFLISSGANVDTQDSSGKTVLDIAKKKENTAVVEYLESIGAKSEKYPLFEGAVF